MWNRYLSRVGTSEWVKEGKCGRYTLYTYLYETRTMKSVEIVLTREGWMRKNDRAGESNQGTL
jgi:hypothetical protein